MQPMGFVLFFIGVTIVFAAKRIVLAKVKTDETDRKELELLAQGGIIAVKAAGFVVAAVGFIFLIL
ncbi:MAG: hypothetical protein AB9856_05360 [Cellulosilyticaceae bacterium]